MNMELLRLCLGYFVVALLWIFLSEPLLVWLVGEPGEQASRYQIAKGAAFVAVTTVLLYIVSNGYAKRLASQHKQSLANQSSLRQAEAVFDGTQEGVLVTDPQQRIVHANPAFSRITGYSIEEVLGQTPKLFASGQHDAAFYKQMWSVLQRDGIWTGEIWNRRRSGEVYPQWQNLRRIVDENGEISHYVAVFSDLSALKRSREELDRLAHFDPLVGLPNRLLFRERAQNDLQRARATRRGGALLLIDLDHFKDINESKGHSFGDALLKCVAKRLSGYVTDSMTLARLGGDEFALLCENHGPAHAASLALRILEHLNQPFRIEKSDLFIGASIGIAVYPDDVQNVDQLMRNADSALFKAKANGRSTYAFYSQELTSQAQQRMELSTALRHAMEQQQLELHYQSIHDLQSGDIIGFEALVRWHHPEQGMISPAAFIPIAEESGLIFAIDSWVLSEACRQMQVWLAEGRNLSFVAVNISSRFFTHGDLDMHVTSILADRGLDARFLELEITESAIMQDPEVAMEQLARLRALGVHLAIDDFGTGHSSLLRLKRMQVQKLKIDQGFVRGLPDSREDAAITRSVIGLAHNLGLRVVAEGIEHLCQADFLFSQGCDFGQGYGFARPKPPAEIDWHAGFKATATNPTTI
jgi:diguanylate cyclase (GGDEF)-like protein/PAS domain S-box-containing protein